MTNSRVGQWTPQQVRGDKLGVWDNKLGVWDDKLGARGDASLALTLSSSSHTPNLSSHTPNLSSHTPSLLSHTPNLSPRTCCGVHFTTAIFFICAIFFAFANQTFAAQKIHEVNYFASLRASETNVRAGPGQNYPIKFTYKLKGIPVQVVSEYDNWNEIKDYEGQSGWVMQSLLTKKRTLMVRTTKSFINLQKKNNDKSRILYRLENNVIGDYLKCVEGWCAMEVGDKKGWVKQEEVFGAD